MLPARSRMHRSEDFRSATRGGVRSGRQTLVVHAGWMPHSRCDGESSSSSPELSTGAPASTPADVTTCSDPGAAPRVGFVVSKAVGNAVTRHRVARQLRHLARPLAEQLPLGCLIVVRALPAAARRPQQLPSDLSSAWTKALDKLQRRTAAQSSTDFACDNRPQTNGRTPDDAGAHSDTADAGAKGPVSADEQPTMSPVRREV